MDRIIENLSQFNDTQKMHQVAQDLLSLQKTIGAHFENPEIKENEAPKRERQKEAISPLRRKAKN